MRQSQLVELRPVRGASPVPGLPPGAGARLRGGWYRSGWSSELIVAMRSGSRRAGPAVGEGRCGRGGEAAGRLARRGRASRPERSESLALASVATPSSSRRETAAFLERNAVDSLPAGELERKLGAGRAEVGRCA